jgi:hypothetical protein
MLANMHTQIIYLILAPIQVCENEGRHGHIHHYAVDSGTIEANSVQHMHTTIMVQHCTETKPIRSLAVT